tara:strand:- start:791 stop:1075 length:285 start_codon:yes stop_codon:yes gene_type:complete
MVPILLRVLLPLIGYQPAFRKPQPILLTVNSPRRERPFEQGKPLPFVFGYRQPEIGAVNRDEKRSLGHSIQVFSVAAARISRTLFYKIVSLRAD